MNFQQFFNGAAGLAYTDQLLFLDSFNHSFCYSPPLHWLCLSLVMSQCTWSLFLLLVTTSVTGHCFSASVTVVTVFVTVVTFCDSGHCFCNNGHCFCDSGHCICHCSILSIYVRKYKLCFNISHEL